MAFSAPKGVLVIASSDTTKTISGLTDPKAILLWTTRQTADGQVASGEFYIGCATYDGAAVQQWYYSVWDANALGTSDGAKGQDTTACLKGFASVTPTIDFELRLTSMDSTSVVIDVFNPPAATIDVHYMVLCGSDITGARAGSWTFTTAGSPPVNQDVTVNTGFGKPDLMVFCNPSNNTPGDSNGAIELNLGVAKPGGSSQRAFSWRANDAAATMDVIHTQKARAFMSHTSTAIDSEADLGATANFPTDGFRVIWQDLPGTADLGFYLALKGTFQAAIGSTSTPTGAATQVQNIDAGFPPVGAIMFGGALATQAGVTTADPGGDTDGLGGAFFGGTDGTNEGAIGYTQNDAHTTSTTRRQHSETKGYGIYTPSNGADSTKRAECDTSFSGNNLSLSWTTTDTGVAREFNYLILGAAAAAAASVKQLAALGAG